MKKLRQASTLHDAFVDWMNSAKPGEGHEYHRGDLLKDLHVSRVAGRPSAEQVEIGRVRRLAWSLYEAGRLHLVQKRHGPFDYSYLAIMRPVRSAASAFARPLAA